MTERKFWIVYKYTFVQFKVSKYHYLIIQSKVWWFYRNINIESFKQSITAVVIVMWLALDFCARSYFSSFKTLRFYIFIKMFGWNLLFEFKQCFVLNITGDLKFKKVHNCDSYTTKEKYENLLTLDPYTVKTSINSTEPALFKVFWHYFDYL